MTNNQSNNDGQQYCLRPDELENGNYLCETNNVVHDTSNSHLLSTGSICQIKCNPLYSIPLHLYQMSSIVCQNGKWNITGIEVCYKEQPIRRHIARRRHRKERFKTNTKRLKNLK